MSIMGDETITSGENDIFLFYSWNCLKGWKAPYKKLLTDTGNRCIFKLLNNNKY